MARGGVGTVYRATHPETGKVYAIKQLSRQFVQDQLVIHAFHQGAAMLMDLRHPSIVKVYYDWDERNEGWQDHFVVMEYLPGETLHDLIRSEAPVPLDDRLMGIINGIGEALSYLHAHDIVHRDIKPENFRLADSRYKLLDFDTAIRRSQRGLYAPDGMPVGTPEYMSPEQARAATDIDFRADVYSLGMLLYELLTGAVPFNGAPSRVLIDQMETAVQSPRKLNALVPEPVADIILMALHKDRDRRFQSISAMMAAFQNAYAATRSTRGEDGASR